LAIILILKAYSKTLIKTLFSSCKSPNWRSERSIPRNPLVVEEFGGVETNTSEEDFGGAESNSDKEINKK
jgi:hypothetical protein